MPLQELSDTIEWWQKQSHDLIFAAGHEELLEYTQEQFEIDKRLISDWKWVIMIAGLMGAWKSTFMHWLIREIPEIILIQSQKTRPPRLWENIRDNNPPAENCIIITESLPPWDYRFHIPVDKTVVAEISIGVDAVREKFARSCLLWLNTDFATAMEQALKRDGSTEWFIDRISNLWNYKNVSEKANIYVPGTLPNNLVICLAIKKLAESIRKQGVE